MRRDPGDTVVTNTSYNGWDKALKTICGWEQKNSETAKHSMYGKNSTLQTLDFLNFRFDLPTHLSNCRTVAFPTGFLTHPVCSTFFCFPFTFTNTIFDIDKILFMPNGQIFPRGGGCNPTITIATCGHTQKHIYTYNNTYLYLYPFSFIPTLVMCMAQPQAKSQAKLGQNRPGQAQPKSWPAHGFGLAWGLSKPKPSHQAMALCHICDSFEITQFNSFLPQPVWDIAWLE